VSDTLTHRLATPADVPAIKALVDLAYARWVPLIGRNPTPMDADYDAAIQTSRFDLLCDGPSLVGLFETAPQPDHYYFINLAVHPDWQGKGLGSRLLRLLESVASDSGHPLIRLETNKAFGANVQLYQSHGFRIDREEAFRGGVAVYMVKELG
jgi:ribosomal protein S18 acetylase RimI-like enzyme